MTSLSMPSHSRNRLVSHTVDTRSASISPRNSLPKLPGTLLTLSIAPSGTQAAPASMITRPVDVFRSSDRSACFPICQRLFRVMRGHRSPALCRQPQRVLVEFVDEDPDIIPSSVSTEQLRLITGRLCVPAQHKATGSALPNIGHASKASAC